MGTHYEQTPHIPSSGTESTHIRISHMIFSAIYIVIVDVVRLFVGVLDSYGTFKISEIKLD